MFNHRNDSHHYLGGHTQSREDIHLQGKTARQADAYFSRELPALQPVGAQVFDESGLPMGPGPITLSAKGSLELNAFVREHVARCMQQRDNFIAAFLTQNPEARIEDFVMVEEHQKDGSTRFGLMPKPSGFAAAEE